MAKIKIVGGQRLAGEVTIGGAKNSTVALIPAAILADTPVQFDSVPSILDVKQLLNILSAMSVSSHFDEGVLDIDPTQIVEADLPAGAIQSLRASYYFMGALLGRFHHAVVTYPGGDNLGERPIDQHIKAFRALGARYSEQGNVITLDAREEGLHGANIFFDKVSVGATMNAIMAATKAKGLTILENVAKEPEIVDLATFLNNMGANIRGAGTDSIRINGVDELTSHTTHTIIPDRIEAGTYISMAAAFGQGVTVRNVIPEHMEAFTAKLEEMGVALSIKDDSIFVPESHDLKPATIVTAEFPGFATDLQQPITPLLLRGHGESTIIESIYPQRIRHVNELRLMGADISSPADGIIKINHTPRLIGSTVHAAEIRAGAALVGAAIMADGETTIEAADHILRGYDRIEEKMYQLGVDFTVIGADMVDLMP